MAKNSRRKPDPGAFFSGLLMVLLGAALGILAGKELFDLPDGLSPGGRLLHTAWLFLMLAAAVYLQLILHEGGHLVCGLLTGYRFVSFRIGSRMLQRENGRLHWHRYALAGTGGQCLLAPPPRDGRPMPYKLYNLGGVLANLLVSLLTAGLALLCRDVWAARVFFEMTSLAGVGIALTNGIPLRVQGIANDGANALYLGRDPAALQAFRIQLSVNARQAEGVALRDMPTEWFTLPTEGLDNIMVAAQAVLHANRLLDEHRFAETAQAIDALEAQQTAILPLHRCLLLCDRLTCALLLGTDPAPLLARWNSSELVGFRRQMKNFLSVLRTEYLVALLADGDTARAERIRAQFETRTATYPFAAEAAGERERLALGRAKAL